MSTLTARAIAQIDAMASWPHKSRPVEWEMQRKLDIYRAAQQWGRIEFVEAPLPADPDDVVLILNAVSKAGAIIRLPVSRGYAATLISQLAKALAS